MSAELHLLILTGVSFFGSVLLLVAFRAIQNISYFPKQLIFGVLFAFLAIMNTHFNANFDGYLVSVRDGIVLATGLVIGAPAGIIVGLLAGIDRYFAAFFIEGLGTAVETSSICVFAGFFCAFLRVFLFNNQIVKWYYGFFITIFIEALHVLLILLVSSIDMRLVLMGMSVYTIPMLISNAILTSSVLFIASFMETTKRAKKEKNEGVKKRKQIVQSFEQWLGLCLVCTLSLLMFFTWSLQTRYAEDNIKRIFTVNINDVLQDLRDEVKRQAIANVKRIREDIIALKEISDENLKAIQKNYNVTEIIIVSKDGLICNSTEPKAIGFDMNSGTQSAALLELFDGKKQILFQDFMRNSINLEYQYTGIVLDKEKIIVVAHNRISFYTHIYQYADYITQNRHIGEEGHVFITDKNNIILSDSSEGYGQALSSIGLDISNTKEMDLFISLINKIPHYVLYQSGNWGTVLATIPTKEVDFYRDKSVYLNCLTQFAVFGVTFFFIYFLVKHLIIDNIKKINESLGEITGGNLNVSVNVQSNEEFASLSHDINVTVETLKGYIAEAKARFDQELEFAKIIQVSSLPNTFPPYPHRKEFDIFASMYTAKEVGGDFYDFYFIDENRLAFLIADVSGKGIPAAMFMMTAKTYIKNYAEQGYEVDEIFNHANEKLCQNNEAEMFVTVWLGILNVKSGLLEFANAGHNQPLIMHKNNEFQPLNQRPNLVLAGMEGIKYKKHTTQLEQGDRLFLYTDGVTEAIDLQENLYSEVRLISLLNKQKHLDVENICKQVIFDVNTFAGEAPQFDDITMLCLNFKGDSNMNEITVDAVVENIDKITDFVGELLEQYNCPVNAQSQINIAIDELVSNIARYAYDPDVGPAIVKVEVLKKPLRVAIAFIDNGMPYDPLRAKTPETNLSAEQRELGGLGIHIVKKIMDEITYEYKNGQNILTIKKNIS